MLTHYSLIKTSKESYGVRIVTERIVKDVSISRKIVCRLVKSCNKYQLDFQHFDDVLENFLEDFQSF